MKVILMVTNVLLIVLCLATFFFLFLFMGSSHNVPVQTYRKIGITIMILISLIVVVSLLLKKFNKKND